MASAPEIEMSNISKHFGAITALNDVSIDFRAGEIHSIVGENGAGKSTLIRILMGYYPSYDGTVRMRGQVVRFGTPRDALRAGIGCVYQERNLAPDLSVAENIFLGRMPSLATGIIDWRKVYRESRIQLRSLGLDLDTTKSVRSCPLGIRQITEIARAIFSGADVIILDEPTSALSFSERENLFHLLSNLKERGNCIIYISHFLEEVLDISDRISILRDGQKVNTYARQALDKETIIRLMTRRFVQSQMKPQEIVSHKPVGAGALLECRDVSIKPNIHNASFSVWSGEAIGFYGNVGSGGSILAEAVFGLHAVESGQIWLGGKQLHNLSPPLAMRAGIRFVPEDRKDAIWTGQGLARNVALASYQKANPILARDREEGRIAMDVIQQMEISPADPKMRIEWFSGGNQQKVVVGRCLLDAPRLLIVCEPANGMDVSAKAGIIRKLGMIKSRGVAIIVCSSDPEVIVETCDRAYVFKHGEICTEVQSDRLCKESLVRNG